MWKVLPAASAARLPVVRSEAGSVTRVLVALGSTTDRAPADGSLTTTELPAKATGPRAIGPRTCLLEMGACGGAAGREGQDEVAAAAEAGAPAATCRVLASKGVRSKAAVRGVRMA